MLKDILTVVANIILLASVLFMGIFGSVILDDAHGSELGDILTTTSGGTCSPKGCVIRR